MDMNASQHTATGPDIAARLVMPMAALLALLSASCCVLPIGLSIIGLGAQGDLERAQAFVEATGTGSVEIDMYWDSSISTWLHFQITGNPYWQLYDAQGFLIGGGPTSVDLDLVVASL